MLMYNFNSYSATQILVCALNFYFFITANFSKKKNKNSMKITHDISGLIKSKKMNEEKLSNQ